MKHSKTCTSLVNKKYLYLSLLVVELFQSLILRPLRLVACLPFPRREFAFQFLIVLLVLIFRCIVLSTSDDKLLLIQMLGSAQQQLYGADIHPIDKPLNERPHCTLCHFILYLCLAACIYPLVLFPDCKGVHRLLWRSRTRLRRHPVRSRGEDGEHNHREHTLLYSEAYRYSSR